MENDDRRASYAAAAGSKSTLNQPVDTVLDSWEEAAQDSVRSEELERSIEQKLGQMKQKQSDMSRAASDPFNNSESGGSVEMQGEGEGPRAAPVIRILKRPQSSGHLPQQGQTRQTAMAAVDQWSSGSRPVASNEARSSRNCNSSRTGQQQRTLEERAAAYAEARMRIFGVADPQIHEDLPVQPKLSTVPRSNPGSPCSTSNR